MKGVGGGLVVFLSVLGLLIYATYSPSLSVAAKSAKANKFAKVAQAADELGVPKT